MFKKGDRVVLLHDAKINLKAGATGTVCCDKKEATTGLIRVRWDLECKKPGFHSCGGNCESGYGFNVGESFIELLDVCPVNEMDFDILNDDLFSIIGGVC